MTKTQASKEYDEWANDYEEEVLGKGAYQLPRIISTMYKKWNITSGTVLDIGCGTGLLADTIGKSFSYTGIDVSDNMLVKAKQRGYHIISGDATDVTSTMVDLSYDHVVVMSCIYFMEDFPKLLTNILRIAKKSVFVSFDNFSDVIIQQVKEESGTQLYNYSSELFNTYTELLPNEFLWRSPINDKISIHGDVVFLLK